MYNKVLIVIITAVLTVVVSTIVNIFGKFDEALSSFVYYKGGGKPGGHQRVSLRAIEGGKAILSMSTAETYSDEPETFEKEVSSDAIKEVEKIFYRYRMRGWAKMRRSDMVVLDADTCSFDFSFGPDNLISFCDNQRLPKTYLQAVQEIMSVIEKYRQ